MTATDQESLSIGETKTLSESSAQTFVEGANGNARVLRYFGTIANPYGNRFWVVLSYKDSAEQYIAYDMSGVTNTKAPFNVNIPNDKQFNVSFINWHYTGPLSVESYFEIQLVKWR